jgi:hypothetical protein
MTLYQLNWQKTNTNKTSGNQVGAQKNKTLIVSYLARLKGILTGGCSLEELQTLSKRILINLYHTLVVAL